MENRKGGCLDLQTYVIQKSKSVRRVQSPSKTKPGHYPVALVPGQFCDYYKKYSPNELRYSNFVNNCSWIYFKVLKLCTCYVYYVFYYGFFTDISHWILFCMVHRSLTNKHSQLLLTKVQIVHHPVPVLVVQIAIQVLMIQR